MNRFLFSVILFVFASFNLFSNDWLSSMTSTFWKYNTDFPVNNALDIEQDYNGYLWIASYEGLIRFDGVDFKVFRNGKGGYPSDTARVLLKGSDKKLWIGTNADGLILMDNYNFIQYDRESGLPDLSIRSLSYDKSGNLWVGTTKGILLIPSADFSLPGKKTFLKNSIINNIFPDNHGHLYAVTNEGEIFVYRSGSFIRHNITKNTEEVLYTAVYSDSKHRKWYGTVSGNIYMQTPEETKEINTKGIFSVKGFVETSDSQIWFWSEAGIGYYDEALSSFYVITEKNGLINNSVNSLFQDREDNLWIISDVSGMQKYSKGKFINYSSSYGLERAVNSVVHQDSSNVLIGTDDGLFTLSNGDLKKTALTDNLKNIRIRNIYKDSRSRLWFSTYSNRGLVVTDSKGNILKNINIENGLSFDKTRTVIEDSDNYIWCGTRSGLNMINPETLEVEKVFTKEDGLSNDYILSLFESSDGKIYIGTDGGGLSILDRKTGNIDIVTADSGKISGNIIFRVSDDKDGNIWICSNKGVSLWTDNKIYHISEDTGLFSNAVFFTYIDSKDSIWFALNNAIQKTGRLNLITHLLNNSPVFFETFDSSDGLLAGITPNSWQDSGISGDIWFPTSRGLSVFDPDKSSLNKIKPNAVVEEVKLDNIAKEGFPDIIDAEVKRIDINYTGFSYVVPEKTMFKYYLEGFDKNWSDETLKRDTSYTNLPAGNYKFFLKVSNNDGYWSSPILAYSFKKKDYFYNSPLFYILVTIFLFLIMCSAFIILQNLQKRKRNELHQVYVDAITSLAGAVEAKDPYTHGHVSRVKDLSSRIGKAMKLGQDKIENLEYMALLHDIGKIGIADTIIRKDGPLDSEELDIMQQHPVIGSKIMADTISLKKMALGARYHHENFDGSGYPDGLKGSQIPLEARIISAADAYDAMTSDRPYRKGLSHETAMEELNKGRGSQFDPEVIDVVNRIMKDNTT